MASPLSEPPAVPDLRRLLPGLGSAEIAWAVFLGSGLSAVATHLGLDEVASFSDVGLPEPGVAGHSGRLYLGRVSCRTVLVFGGRLHLYEGHDLEAVTRAVRAAAIAGAPRALLANAAGGLAPDMVIGDLMLIRDHISIPGLCGYSAVGATARQPWPRFVSQDGIYDRQLIAAAEQAAGAHRLRTRQGVYAMVAGPQYESPAERELLCRLGADAVGMSTAPEALAAHALGVHVLGLSVITNTAAQTEPPTHEEVARVSGAACTSLAAIIRGLAATVA